MRITERAGRCTTLLLLAGLGLAAGAAEPARAPTRAASTAAPVLMLSADGGEVIDTSTGLVWSRCVEGMRWSGRRCTGEAAMLSLPQARRAASARAGTEGQAWRLPRVPELRRLRDHALHGGRGLAAWFPDAPEEALWTSTVNAGAGRTINPYNYGNVMQGRTTESAPDAAFTLGWAMDLPSGATQGDVSTARRLALRLVRHAAPAGAVPAPSTR